MKPNYSVRLASPDDAAQLTNWLNNTKDNLFDPSYFLHPNMRVLVVEKDGQPIIYFPFDVVFQGGSLALKPDTGKKDLAYGFRVLEDALLKLAQVYGVKEIYTQCAEPTFTAFSLRHKWTEVKNKYLRRKV